MAEKKGAEKVVYADSADTATLEHPDSGRNQNAMVRSAPADMARTEVTTPTVLTYPDEKGRGQQVRPVTTQESDGTETAEVQCPDGHAGGKGRAATGTIGKTATCGNCGQLLIPAEVVREGSGEPVKLRSSGGKVTVSSGTEKATANGRAKAKGDRTGKGRKAPARAKKAARAKGESRAEAAAE